MILFAVVSIHQAITTASSISQRKQKKDPTFGVDGMYRSMRTLPNKLQYDYNRRQVRKALNSGIDNAHFTTRLLPDGMKPFRDAKYVQLLDRASASSNVDCVGCEYTEAIDHNFIDVTDSIDDDTISDTSDIRANTNAIEAMDASVLQVMPTSRTQIITDDNPTTSAIADNDNLNALLENDFVRYASATAVRASNNAPMQIINQVRAALILSVAYNPPIPTSITGSSASTSVSISSSASMQSLTKYYRRALEICSTVDLAGLMVQFDDIKRITGANDENIGMLNACLLFFSLLLL